MHRTMIAYKGQEVATVEQANYLDGFIVALCAMQLMQDHDRVVVQHDEEITLEIERAI